MNNVTTFSSIAAELQQPESLITILRVYHKMLAAGTARLPVGHLAALCAVHGGILSRRFISATATEISTGEPDALRQWLNSVWCPLHQAALENDAEAFFCAEVNLLKTELKKTDLQSLHSLGCISWASLTGLDLISSLPEPLRAYPFRVGVLVSRLLTTSAQPGGKRRTMAEWREITFPSSLTLQESELLPHGWLDLFICRAERVFTSACRQAGLSDTKMSTLPAGAFPAPQHLCASVQVHCRIPEFCPDVSVGETHLAPETASAQGHTAPLCPAQPIGLAEEE
ncbi:hypothetical protein MLN78_08220 [Escherichia coli]|nr:hypothetical protein [Escherichia coli]HBP4332674.1 hypothetical protein [Escherichia coli]